jgi:hypothetical protein
MIGLRTALLTVTRKWDYRRAACAGDRPWPTRPSPIADVVPQPANGPLRRASQPIAISRPLLKFFDPNYKLMRRPL